jgi:transposase
MLSNEQQKLIDENIALKALLQKKDSTIKYLEEKLILLQIKKFASQSEKHLEQAKTQLNLFNEAEELFTLNDDTNEDDIDSAENKVTIPEHSRSLGRKKLPADLPREEVIIDLNDEEKICPHDGSLLNKIGQVESESLDIIPAKIKIIKTIRLKYACPCCLQTIKTAANPIKLLPKTMATPGLLSHIAISKYCDHLPLYRQEKILERMGIELNRNTLAEWMIKVGVVIQPLINLLQDKLLEENYISFDETPVQVLKEDGKKAQSKSWMWVQLSYGLKPIVLYHYDPSRSSKVPKKLLTDFSGYLQVDGYTGYDPVFSENKKIIRVGCWAHARRKFMDAYKVGSNKNVANSFINLIKELYLIEEKIREMPPDEKLNWRQNKSLIFLDKIKDKLDLLSGKTPPKSKIGEAINYCLNEWDNLKVYLTNGILHIDNNLIENVIRPFCLGRKNWLFSASVNGAEASSNFYSLLHTCYANGLEPYNYLRYIFAKLPEAKTVDDFEKLLPTNLTPEVVKI